MRKKYLLIGLLFIAIGFAAVTTTLVINGTSTIKKNDDAFKVYYSDALVNGTQDLSVVVDDTHLSFKTTLDTLGQTYVLDYDVTNSSKQYDAQLTMNCTGGNEYLTVVNTFNTADNLLATDTRRGKLTLTLAKSYSGADMDVEIVCTLGANAVERNSEATGTPKDPVAVDEILKFCRNKGFAYGMTYINTYNSNEFEQGDELEYYICSDSEDFEEYYSFGENGDLITVNGFPASNAEKFCVNNNYKYGMDYIQTYQGTDLDEYLMPSYRCTNDADYKTYDYYAIDGTLLYKFTGGIDPYIPED